MSNREDYGWLLDRLRELVLQIEALVQERRPVAVVQTPRGTEYAYADGTRMLWQVDPDGARASEWAELPPLPGTRRDRELEDSPTPADYSGALDRTTAIAAAVEAAQRLRRHDKVFRRPRFVPVSPVWEQLFVDLMDALAALERQQETEGGRDG